MRDSAAIQDTSFTVNMLLCVITLFTIKEAQCIRINIYCRFFSPYSSLPGYLFDLFLRNRRKEGRRRYTKKIAASPLVSPLPPGWRATRARRRNLRGGKIYRLFLSLSLSLLNLPSSCWAQGGAIYPRCSFPKLETHQVHISPLRLRGHGTFPKWF